jgi:hypothetical protein
LAAKLALSCARVEKGPGSWSVSLARDTRPSRRPPGMFTSILPLLRRKDASRAAKATMSVQETVRGQARSTAALAASITSNPRRLFLLGGPSLSAGSLGVVTFSRMEASHP